MRSYAVFISGAGLAGLTLARALSVALPNGHRVALIDSREPASDAQGGNGHDLRASALGAASQRLLSAVGIWDALSDAATPMREIDITDAALGSPVRQVLLHYTNSLGNDEPASYVVRNDALLAALDNSVRGDDRIELIAPASIDAMDARDQEGRVSLRLGEGTGSQPRLVSAGLVVSAEGRGSALRERAGIGAVGWPYGQVGIVTNVRFAKPHHGRATQHFLPGGPFAVLPLGVDEASIVWSEDAGLAKRLMALDDAAFQAEFEARLGGLYGEVVELGGRASWPLSLHIARRMTGDRLALIGDAAHGVHPIAGQGFNLALRDVAALVEVIVDSLRLGLDCGGAEPLERYARWRRFDAIMSAFAYDGLNRLFSNDNQLLRAVRQTGLRAVDRLPWLKEKLVEEAAGLSGDLPLLLKGELP